MSDPRHGRAEKTGEETSPNPSGRQPLPDNREITVDFFRQLDFTRAIGFILMVSALAFLFLIWLIYFRESAEEAAGWVGHLPALNALLNSASTVLILLGYAAIRKRLYVRHMKLMMAAFVTSSLFLISYMVYHHNVGHTPFPGEGWIRPVYFTILVSHIILSAFVVPLVLTSFYLAWSGRLRRHRTLSRWTLPVWLYVSVTGVAIFFILNAHL